ncbi:MAG TPA: response regulator [Chitinophagaceae bacterium]|nr:response regulator [Chitinophagaceae bacterium]
MPFKKPFKFFSAKRSEAEKGNIVDFSALFDFLAKEISVPRNAEHIIRMARQAVRKNSEDQLSIYLLFESHLCNFDPEKKYTRESLRQTTSTKFPFLLNDPFFSILFLDEEQKKVKLGAFLIRQFLQLCIQKFGGSKDNFLEKKQIEFTTIFTEPGRELGFTYIEASCAELRQVIGDSWGQSLTAKIFEQAFQETARRFKEFESFPILVSLLPKETLGREHLHMLNQTQIEQILLEKLTEVQNLNAALQKQIGETKRAEKLADQNEATLSSIISSTLDAIVTMDYSGIVIRWNPAAEDTFGFSEEEACGRQLHDLIIPLAYRNEYIGGMGNYFLRHQGKIINKRLEIVLMRKGGIEIPGEMSITTVTDNNEIYFHGFFRDISDRKKREKEILLMKEQAELASLAKAQFLSVMSHEIRTPLNSVIGFAHLLLDNNPREDQVEYLNVLKFSGENLLSLVNDILDFSKLESGKAELEESTFSLKLLIENVYKSLLPKATEKGIQLSYHYDPSLTDLIDGDSVRIGQVLINLISNAIKFTGSGSVSLQLKVIEETAGYYKTHFSVNDTGIGIPQDKQDKIFELFTQADGSTRRKYGGTGLGLNIAQKIILLMGGKLEVSSEEGKGSQFYFTVMLKRPGHQVAEPVSPAESAEDHPTILHGVTILIAEDHHPNSFLAKQFLTKWGAVVSIVENGAEALAKVSDQKFDMILMDLQMPVMDGFEASTRIRKSHPDLPILALTASRSEEIEAKVFAAGMNDIVSKPFKPKELRTKIVMHLKKKSIK